eukprot:gnl/Carplike_NY0171/1047_a1433_621.p4 GENE.gnl/Carplike_NY0171/1047_a1433_621~~gnl/Carplike_NY0171/1047_a1433_621.p4  ORF type:complete len:110 (+),score=5.83 gnl/Carplike_NY0171/1047_a1433_621:40-369(+)
MHSTFFRSALLLSALLLSGCEETPPERMKTGEEIYNYYCKSCHEQKGPGAEMERYSGTTAPKPYKVMLMIKFDKSTSKHHTTTFNQLSDEQAEAVSEYTVSLIEKQLQK